MKKIVLSLIFGIYLIGLAHSQDLVDLTDKNNDRLLSNRSIDISNLYPNPANQYVVFDYLVLNDDTKATITFRNVLGSEIKSYELSHMESSLIVSLDKFSSGIYFYTLSLNDKKLVTKKFIVKK
ncbi:T9SS type A sorting domain-containing protein [Flammeovirgaceae bacterium SG7u.111]|nr:T9SS type A sorting domain-containing protein [Flammeovirgaceae bacterium SG7u.132]WPO34101.1 T9SS type A sorting domain-containing protein [Flammeovirgaceae bacterium SG7u.111]